jgi:hypothetical protein
MNRTLERRLVLQAMVGVDEIYPDKTKISLEDWLEAYSRELIVLTAQECGAKLNAVETLIQHFGVGNESSV